MNDMNGCWWLRLNKVLLNSVWFSLIPHGLWSVFTMSSWNVKRNKNRKTQTNKHVGGMEVRGSMVALGP